MTYAERKECVKLVNKLQFFFYLGFSEDVLVEVEVGWIKKQSTKSNVLESDVENPD